MILENLIWLPIILFTGTFLYNSALGLVQVIKTLSKKTRSAAIQKLLWTQFLFSCYHACFSTSSLLHQYVVKRLAKWIQAVDLSSAVALADSSVAISSTVTTRFGGIESCYKEGLMSYVVNSCTSHTICAIFGAIAFFGTERTVLLLGNKYKKMEKEAKQAIHMFLDIVFHTEFFLGTYLWFRYCFAHVFSHQRVFMAATEAWNLAMGHTLAFSIGVFVVKDFILRTKKKRGGKASKNNQEGSIIRYYSLCAVSILALRVGYQVISTIYHLPPPDDLYVVCIISISLFGMLPSRVLLGYVIPPILVFILSTAATRFVDFAQWGSVGNAICTLGGLCIGIYLRGGGGGVGGAGRGAEKGGVGVNGGSGVQELPSGMNGSRMHRAWAYPPPFPNGWYRVAGSEEIQPGDVKQVICLGRQFAVFRGEDSEKVSVTDAFCPHLGANMALGGKVVQDTLECPFHLWRFDGAGKCVHIPEANTIPEVAKVKTWPTHEYMGNIYMWWHAEGHPPSYQPLNDESFDKGNMKFYGELQQPMYLHPQDVAENSADFAHFNIVHGKLHVPLLSLFTYIRHSIDVIRDAETPHILQFKNKALVYSVFNDDVPMLPDNTSTVVTILGPSTVMYFRIFTPLGYVMITKTFLPHRALECTMVDRLYAEKSVPSLLAWYVFREAKHAFLEDGVIWNHKTYPKNPILVRDDKPIKEFRRWYSQFYTANSRRESMGANAVEYEEPARDTTTATGDRDKGPLISTKHQDVVFGCKAHAGLDW